MMDVIANEAQNRAEVKATWRELAINQIGSLIRVAEKIHPGLPESDEVFAERIKHFPEGCLALIEGDKGDQLYGYAISHPIRFRQPPALDSLLGEIVPDANQYYIHDLAILPEVRGRGLAQECIEKLLNLGKRYKTTCLVSVYGTTPFWGRFGFVPVEMEKNKLLDNGADAAYLERRDMEYESR